MWGSWQQEGERTIQQRKTGAGQSKLGKRASRMEAFGSGLREHDPPVTEELCRRAFLRRPGAIATAPSARAAPSLQYCWKAEQRRLHPG